MKAFVSVYEVMVTDDDGKEIAIVPVGGRLSAALISCPKAPSEFAEAHVAKLKALPEKLRALVAEWTERSKYAEYPMCTAFDDCADAIEELLK